MPKNNSDSQTYKVSRVPRVDGRCQVKLTCASDGKRRVLTYPKARALARKTRTESWPASIRIRGSQQPQWYEVGCKLRGQIVFYLLARGPGQRPRQQAFPLNQPPAFSAGFHPYDHPKGATGSIAPRSARHSPPVASELLALRLLSTAGLACALAKVMVDLAAMGEISSAILACPCQSGNPTSASWAMARKDGSLQPPQGLTTTITLAERYAGERILFGWV